MYRSSPDCILRMHIRLGTRLGGGGGGGGGTISASGLCPWGTISASRLCPGGQNLRGDRICSDTVFSLKV